MSKNTEKKQLIFDKYKNNLNLLNKLGFVNTEQDVYICPICLDPHRSLEENNFLTLEDAPPKSLGGKAKTLTCKKCNNEAGHKIDFHLAERLNEIDKQKFLPNTNINVRTKIGSETFNGTLSVDEKGIMTMLHSNKNNHPEKLKTAMESVDKGQIIDLNFLKSRIVPEKLECALLKSAYIILFEKTGYSLILNPIYDIIREQLNNPDKRIYPENFWFNNANNIKEGVYFSMEKGLECIMVVLNVDTGITKRGFFILLPLPINNFEQVISDFNIAIDKKQKISLYPAEGKQNDYLKDETTINKLFSWIKGKNIKN